MAVAAAALALAGLLAARALDDDDERRPPPPRAEQPAPTGLAVGISDRGANLLWADPRGGPFEPWRARVEALRPRWYRLMVDWSQLQPQRDGPFLFEQPDGGCGRGAPPCAEFAGMRDVLRAVRSQQREHGGWEVVATIYGVPEWAARPPGGCERASELPRSRPSTAPDAIAGYRRLVRAVRDLGRREGIEIRWWSAWNEPNQPWFVSPQRRRCDARAPSLAPGVYTRLVQALRAELPDARLVLGELAAASGPKPFVTGISEFVSALPDEVACAGEVWAQHQYAERDEEGAAATGAEAAGGVEGVSPKETGAGSGDTADAVAELKRVLDERACTRGKPIWVTETGVGGPHVGARRSRSPAELRADCLTLERALRRWDRDPRVQAAFQYSLREDAAFPVGVFDTELTRAYPVYELWRSASAGRVACPR
ncbi:MAG TPA: hypothetical protein VHF89_06265 [Solirubrobacteraceae bacterium]|nr:hypothetical protein [Solirubrobacteraceae bacterium]